MSKPFFLLLIAVGLFLYVQDRYRSEHCVYVLGHWIDLASAGGVKLFCQ
jgi:hypothetical protein